MQLSKNEKYNEIKAILRCYLRENHLLKLACCTNCPPTKHDDKYLVEHFNYICFCASNYLQLSHVLLSKYRIGYKKIPFNVFVLSLEACLNSRQFGYICLKCKDLSFSQNYLGYIASNRQSINRRHPILLRLLCQENITNSLVLPHNVRLERSFSKQDLMLIVQQ